MERTDGLSLRPARRRKTGPESGCIQAAFRRRYHSSLVSVTYEDAAKVREQAAEVICKAQKLLAEARALAEKSRDLQQDMEKMQSYPPDFELAHERIQNKLSPLLK